MPAHAIFWPALALAFLTFAVWLRLFQRRIGEMRRLRIHPQSVATSPQAVQRFVDTRAADNFRNLLELPLLFYVALGIAYATGTAAAPLPALAWAFVALRALHSFIHCGYNRVMHRFAAYVAGGFVLWAIWAVLAWRLLR
jgi:hypothetical protein